MDTALVAALSALGGALVGAFAASINTFITQRAETRRTCIIQAAETRRHMRTALFNAAKISRDEAADQLASVNQYREADDQLVNLALTDYFLIALKFEEDFHNLDSLDDERLEKLADNVDGTFTKLLIHRVERSQDNRIAFRSATQSYK